MPRNRKNLPKSSLQRRLLGKNPPPNINYYQLVCDVCGERFCVTVEWREKRIADGRDFYCPNGDKLTYDPRKKQNEAESDAV